ncbi:MAG: type II toxin-antitoxin system PemK/MazF family toxin [Candidatus Micrarchaeota archaeon]|nr:type II toxin-antitoxin system PemK/MazF family toxin [Candidatus Micrarchaeota archaeon]
MGEILRQKQIILVPFPFSDQSGTKRRPALIISNDKFDGLSSDIIICAVTSNISNDIYSVKIKPEDWKNGLYSESCVKVANICTVDKRLVIKTIGRLSSERFKEVMTKVYGIIN